MPKKALRCHVEIDIHSVTSPGTWLLKREDVYIIVRLFSQVRRTRYVSAVFPLLFHEKFKFDKAFYTAHEPCQVAESLEDCMVRIELVQLSDSYKDGRLLAWYESSARDFLYPYSSYSSSYGTHDRELLLERTLAFPGISPRMEFSTKTVIQQTVSPLLEPWDLDEEVARYTARSPRRSRSRTRSKSPGPLRRSGSFSRPTIASITRCRSVSPTPCRRSTDFDDFDYTRDVEERPPFVVRKVQNNLIGRKPGTVHKRSHSAERKRSSSPAASSQYGLYNRDYLRKSYDYGCGCESGWRHRYSSYDLDGYNGYHDSRLLIDSPYYRRLKAEALSPVHSYYTPYRDHYDTRPWSPTHAELIRDRVDRALRRDRSLERLDYPRTYRPYVPRRDSLCDLELDFELARRRKYYP